MAYSTYLQTFTDSIGASGAIFGVIGALLWMVLKNKGKVESITLGKIMFLAIYSLYSGFISTNVDNAAHIGGFIGGIWIAMAVGVPDKSNNNNKINGIVLSLIYFGFIIYLSFFR